MTNTPTPRTDKVVSSDMGDSGFIVDLIKHSQQLERELDNSIKIQDGMAMTILSLQAERDQLRKVCDEFAIPYVLERKTK